MIQGWKNCGLPKVVGLSVPINPSLYSLKHAMTFLVQQYLKRHKFLLLDLIQHLFSSCGCPAVPEASGKLTTWCRMERSFHSMSAPSIWQSEVFWEWIGTLEQLEDGWVPGPHSPEERSSGGHISGVGVARLTHCSLLVIVLPPCFCLFVFEMYSLIPSNISPMKIETP